MSAKIATLSQSEAEKLTTKIKKHWKKMEHSWIALGQMIDFALRRHVPATLGKNAKQWLEECVPGSTAKAFRALRIVRALEKVPEKQVKKLTEGNAYALSRLPEKQRTDKKMLKAAVEQPTEQFRETVASELEKRGVHREDFVAFRMSMPRAVYDLWEKAIQKVARACDIDIETSDGRRIQVYERLANFIDDIPEADLKQAIEGGE